MEMNAENKIYVNIWDDYHDDGFVPEGEIQETYAYIESELNDEDCKAVLEALKEKVDALSTDSSMTTEIEFHDSSKVHPSLVGTEHEWMLYTRWQLRFKNITHQRQEQLVEQLQEWGYQYKSMYVSFYSES